MTWLIINFRTNDMLIYAISDKIKKYIITTDLAYINIINISRVIKFYHILSKYPIGYGKYYTLVKIATIRNS